MMSNPINPLKLVYVFKALMICLTAFNGCEDIEFNQEYTEEQNVLGATKKALRQRSRSSRPHRRIPLPQFSPPQPIRHQNSDHTEPLSYADPRIQATLDLPIQPLDYQTINMNDSFAREALITDNTPSDNLADNHRATLGRVLFYDTLLSHNEHISCAACHQQNQGFSDPEIRSLGFEGERTGRHSMSLINNRYYANGSMFWDERAHTLEAQVLGPIQDSIEMGLSLNELLSRLENTLHYPIIFELAFGDTNITTERVSFALSNFVRSIQSSQTPYDQGLALTNGNPIAGFQQLQFIRKPR